MNCLIETVQNDSYFTDINQKPNKIIEFERISPQYETRSISSKFNSTVYVEKR